MRIKIQYDWSRLLMKKLSLLIMSSAIILVIFTGCQSSTENSDGDISKVSISNSNSTGKINSDFFAVYEDIDTLDLFQDVILDATKKDIIVSMGTGPDYDLEVVYENGDKQEYHLWIGDHEQTSTLMHVDDTHTIYLIPEQLTNQLIKLIQ